MRSDGSIYIENVVSDGAKEQGIRINDTLVAINDKPLGLLHFAQIIEFVRSLQVGSEVKLLLARENLEQDDVIPGNAVSGGVSSRGSRCTSIDAPLDISQKSRRKSIGISN